MCNNSRSLFICRTFYCRRSGYLVVRITVAIERDQFAAPGKCYAVRFCGHVVIDRRLLVPVSDVSVWLYHREVVVVHRQVRLCSRINLVVFVRRRIVLEVTRRG